MNKRLDMSLLRAISLAMALLLSSCSNANPNANTPEAEPPVATVTVTDTEAENVVETDKTVATSTGQTPVQPSLTVAQPTVKEETTTTPIEPPVTAANPTSTSGEYQPPRLLTPAELGWVERNLPSPPRNIIIDQSFWLNLGDLGEGAFVATQAVDDPTQAVNNLAIDLMLPNGEISQTLPPNEDASSWMLWEMKAVTFEELDFDGPSPDAIVIADYITGVGPTGSEPFPVTTVYFNQGTYFTTDQSLNRLLTDRSLHTIAEVIEVMRNELMYLP